MKKTIGILGGMGPLATADLFTKIVNLTKADCDNDHIRVFIDSNSAIPDRTAAILGKGDDPIKEMTTALRHLELCGADCILIPCNTAHYFLPKLQEKTDIKILNMPEITAEQCRQLYPGKCACILATRGALLSGVYHKALEAQQVPYVVPDDSEQETLMHLIYDVVKASKPVKPEAETWQKVLSGLRTKGADYFLLACTELPILAAALTETGPFVDPTTELAKAAIRFCGYEVRE